MRKGRGRDADALSVTAFDCGFGCDETGALPCYVWHGHLFWMTCVVMMTRKKTPTCSCCQHVCRVRPFGYASTRCKRMTTQSQQVDEQRCAPSGRPHLTTIQSRIQWSCHTSANPWFVPHTPAPGRLTSWTARFECIISGYAFCSWARPIARLLNSCSCVGIETTFGNLANVCKLAAQTPRRESSQRYCSVVWPDREPPEERDAFPKN